MWKNKAQRQLSAFVTMLMRDIEPVASYIMPEVPFDMGLQLGAHFDWDLSYMMWPYAARGEAP